MMEDVGPVEGGEGGREMLFEMRVVLLFSPFFS